MFKEIMFPIASTLGDNLEHILGTLLLTFSLSAFWLAGGQTFYSFTYSVS